MMLISYLSNVRTMISCIRIRRNLFFSLSIFLALISLKNSAQEPSKNEIDLKILKGTDRISLLSQIASEYAFSDAKKAIVYAEEALSLEKKNNIPENIKGKLFSTLGAAYYTISDYKKSIKYYEKELELIAASGMKEQIMLNTYNIATLHMINGNPRAGLEYYIQSIAISEEINDTAIYIKLLNTVYPLCAQVGRYKDAFDYLDKLIQVQKLLHKEKVSILESKYVNELHEKQQKAEELKKTSQELEVRKEDVHEKENELIQAAEKEVVLTKENIEKSARINKLTVEARLKQKELELQRITTYGAICIACIILISLIFILQLFRKNKKSYHIIRHKNKQISESINYAQRIQNAVLPQPQNTLSKYFSDHFVLFKPKDIVSGDFFWFNKKNDLIYVVAADCTGHGVPGAFMSMMGVAFLDDIVDGAGHKQPDIILNELRSNIIKTLQQEEDSKTKDGMDIAIIVIDTKNNTLLYAGANNPLYILRNKDLIQLKPDHMPIAHYTVMQPFACHEMQLQTGDCIYLFSDGYVDQLGGNQHKKFMYSTFRNLLIDIADMPMNEQMQKLENTHKHWKGNSDQTDDILVIGCKVV